MKIEITLAGITWTLSETLPIRRGQAFPGSGNILASAIVRESKNRYRVYVILEEYAWNRISMGIKKAAEYLEEVYRTWGSLIGKKIPSAGEKQ